MKNSYQSAALWILSIVLMGTFGVYQRTTGPTYPVKGKIVIKGETVKYELLRSHNTGKDAPVKIQVPEGITANFRYKRFKSHDTWTAVELKAEKGVITTGIPHQPPAGKMEYQLALMDGDVAYPLTEDPVVIRFKGEVPDFVLVPHIFFMFFAMVFGIRTSFEALLNRKNTYRLTSITVVLMIIGGLILGPIVQKYAFGAYWTGWPWGHDLTDNKTFIMFIFWAIAWLKLRKQPDNKIWPVVAMVIMVAVYLIPHSVLGSEIDHTKTTPNTELKQ